MQQERTRCEPAGTPEAVCRAVCRTAVRLGETLELRHRAGIALDSFIQLSGASGAALFLAMGSERFVQVATAGAGLKQGRPRSIERPGLEQEIARLPGAVPVKELPRSSASLAEVRRQMRDLGARWVVPLSTGRGLVGMVCLAGQGPAESYQVGRSWALSELAQLTATALANAQAYEMAIFDEPTGLLAPRYYHLRLREEMRRAIRHHKALSLLLAQLEGGPDGVGEERLRECAGRMRDLIRADLDIPARYAESEFAVILPDTALEGAKVLAGRIRESLSGSGGNGGAGLTVSVGIASYPEHADTVEELCACAERALSEAADQRGIAALPASERQEMDYRALRRDVAPPYE